MLAVEQFGVGTHSVRNSMPHAPTFIHGTQNVEQHALGSMNINTGSVRAGSSLNMDYHKQQLHQTVNEI